MLEDKIGIQNDLGKLRKRLAKERKLVGVSANYCASIQTDSFTATD